MMGVVACAVWLCVGASTEYQEEQKAARHFEASTVAQERAEDKAARNWERIHGRTSQQAAVRAQRLEKEKQEQALERFFPPLPVWGLQLRFGAYRPTISTNPQVQDLYNLVFVRNSHAFFRKRPLQMGLEFDYYVPHLTLPLGQLGVYGRASYWRIQGATRLCTNATGTPIACTPSTVFQSVQGQDSATLSIVPLSFGALWRLDTLYRKTPVPLLFHVKFGLDYHFWWGDSGTQIARYRGHKAVGGTWGYSTSFGISYVLNMFTNPGRKNSRDIRVQNAIFAEYQIVRGHALFGPRRDAKLDFTDHTLGQVGVAIDFY